MEIGGALWNQVFRHPQMAAKQHSRYGFAQQTCEIKHSGQLRSNDKLISQCVDGFKKKNGKSPLFFSSFFSG